MKVQIPLFAHLHDGVALSKRWISSLKTMVVMWLAGSASRVASLAIGEPQVTSTQ
jgi:hypothetical protein